MLRRLGLGHKIAAVYLLLAVPLLAAMSYSYYDRYRVGVDESIDRRAELAVLVGDTFRLYVGEMQQTMGSLSEQERELPTAASVKTLTTQYPAEFAVALDSSGRTIASSRADAAALDLGGHAAFAPLLSGEASNAITPMEPCCGSRGFFVTQALPAEDGSVRAVVGAFVDLERLQDSLPFRYRRVAASVIDPTGRVVYQTEYEDLSERSAAFGKYPFVHAALRGGHGRSDHFVCPTTGARHHAAAEPIGDTGWVAASSMEHSDAMRPILASVGQSAMVSFGAALIALLAGIALAKGMLGSVGRLHVATERLGRADFTSRATVHGGDEFGQLSAALERTREQLRHHVDSLAALADAGRSLSRSLKEDDVRDEVERAAHGLLNAEAVWVLLRPPGESRLERFLWRDDWDDGWCEALESLSRSVMRSGSPGNAPAPPHGGEPASLVAVPLSAGRRTIGALGLVGEGEGRWEPGTRELEVLCTLAGQVALAIRNARTYAAERNVADTLQTALLQLPQAIDGLVFDGVYRSATQEAYVGGDFFDLFVLGPGRFGALLGDISGKGLAAAALTAFVKDVIRAYSMEHASCGEVVRLTSEALLARTGSDTFATLFFGVIDTREGSLAYCNAGHPPGVVLSAGGRLERLSPTGSLAGAFPDLPFDEAVVGLMPEDVLLLYTDGVLDVRSPDGEQFGEERLEQVLAAGIAPESGARTLLAALDDFTGGAYCDDVAILTVSPRRETT